MFNQFKKIVNSSLDELERLSDSVVQQQLQQQQQPQSPPSQQQIPGLLNHGGRGYSESSLSTFQAGSSGGGFPGLGPGRTRSPNGTHSQLRASEGSTGYPTYQPRSATAHPAVAVAPSGSSASALPLAIATTINTRDGSSSSSIASPPTRGAASDSFPSFGLGGLGRSRSSFQRASLDLGNLRNTAYDYGGGSSPGGAMTPSRDGRELPEWSGTRVSSPSPGPRMKRRSSGRAASISGPFTPNTMQKMDPFFFVALQGLPDELKIAAFTPLPKEDADEELDQIDQELNPTFHSLPISLPKLDTSGGLSRSVPPSFRPMSAPASGPAQSFVMAQMARSPLVEQTRSSLLSQALHDHDEVEEEDHHEPSPFSHTPEMPAVEVMPLVPQESAEASAGVTTEDSEASPMPRFDDLPDVDREGRIADRVQEHDEVKVQPVPYGRLSASSTPRRGRSPAPAERTGTPPVIVEPQIVPPTPEADPSTTTKETSPSQQDIFTPQSAPTPSQPILPPTPKVHESLQARLARISRAASPINQPSTSPSNTASATGAPLAAAASTKAVVSEPGSSTAETAQTDETKSSISPTSDASHSAEELKRMQADKLAIEKLLYRCTSVNSLGNLSALEDYFKNQTSSAASSKADAEAAAKKLQESDKQLRARVATLEAEVKEVQAAVIRAESKAKDEEEKKAKSITLLKAVRQKSIKAEKDKEEAEMMRDALKVSEENLTNETKSLRQRFEQETMGLRQAQEGQLARLRSSYEREAQSIRANYEREAAARRGQTEMDILNLRQSQARELSARDGRIAVLEANLRDLKREKDTLFETLQSRQAEVESAVANQERVQVAYDELQYEMKDSGDKVVALQEEVASFKKARLDQTRDEGHTRRLLSELEASNADKIRVFEDRIKQLERERSESEDSMARKLQEKLREVERMRRDIERRDAENGEETQRREERQHRMDRAEGLNRTLQEKVNALEMLLNEAKLDNSRVKEDEATAKELLADQNRRTAELEARLEELSSKEIQLRGNNKTLREELRKVQSGVLLSERSRNPGVGYFSNFGNNNASSADGGLRPASPFSPALGSQPMNSRASSTNGSIAGTGVGTEDEKETQLPPNSATSSNMNGNSSAEEAMNFEYVRNVILQFLEHKEMRPHLVSVLGVILHFTPGETRRLAAKASA